MSASRLYPLLWATVFVGSGIGAYLLVRNAFVEPHHDPTRDRIQALIDEADQLLRTLDDQRRT